MEVMIVITTAVGPVTVGIRKKSKLRGWIPLLALLRLLLAPQIYLWKTRNRGYYELRIIDRFALLYIALFIIPLGVRYTRREI